MRQQTAALDFYRRYIIPYLGSCPDVDGNPKWQSFMTDDFTPIEFSWNWGCAQGDVDRRIRFSIEAIGDHAGTAADPWNQKATVELVDKLEGVVPDINLEWFRWLLGKTTPATTSPRPELRGPHSSMFLAFELGREEVSVLKAYMLPFGKAVQNSQTSSQVIFESLKNLAHHFEWSSLQALIQSLESKRNSFGLEPFMIAFDCVAPAKSRMKIYARSTDTTLATAETIMSIFENSSKIQNGLVEFRKLWSLVMNPNLNPKGRSTNSTHDTSGMLYYFEVRPRSGRITTKIYLPVKHYGLNDLAVAHGLQTFIRERESSKEKMTMDYLHTLHQICTHCQLSSSTGLQTYISCKLENDSLQVTSYLSPEIYHEGRWQCGGEFD